MGSGRKFLPLYLGIIIAGIAIVAVQRVFDRQRPAAPAIKVSGPVIVPPHLNEQQKLGALAYGQACSDCHGLNLTGTSDGPSLLVERYRGMPDEDYLRAMERGAPATEGNWSPMPSVSGLSTAEQAAVIAYIRRMQSINPLPSQ